MALICQICDSPDAALNLQPMNGLPSRMVVCEDCKQLVREREIGVVRRPDGSLHVCAYGDYCQCSVCVADREARQ